MLSPVSTSSFGTDKNVDSTHSKSYHLWAKIFAPLLILVLIISTTVLGVMFRKSQSSSSTEFATDQGIIGFPIRLPDDGRYVQWTFLQLNDVYEILAIENGRKPTLTRVAHMRKLLLEENKQTYTFLAGDLVSPSGLSQSVVNDTALRGRHMIAIMNAIGVDYMTFGNHEFDLKEAEIHARVEESNFTWICANVFDPKTNKSFSSSVPYKLLNIDSVRILIFGLTIFVNKTYVYIVDKPALMPFVKKFLQSISHIQYDVLIALTHLSLSTDIELVNSFPQINLIMGGHEHENYYQLRGPKYTPIAKADSNALSVFIHRCAFNLDTRQFRIYSNLAVVTSDVKEDQEALQVVNYWYNAAINGFEDIGYRPTRTVSCLSDSIELDGRFKSVRNFPTLLSDVACECMVYETADNQTVAGLFDSGSIRLDDILRGTITQYDILRTLPFENTLYSLLVPGQVLAKILNNGRSAKGSILFLSYCGVETKDDGKTWLINGQDISKTGLKYTVATMSHARRQIKGLEDPTVIELKLYNITQTKSLINYLPTKYPPC